MKWTLLGLLALVLFLAWTSGTIERYVDAEFTSGGTTGSASAVTRPCGCPNTASVACPVSCKAWESKVSANAPTGAVSADYISVLAAFFDTVYDPAETKPTEAQVDTFLASSAGTVSGVNVPSVKRIIMDAFHIDSGMTAAASEYASQNFKPDTAILEDKMGRDEVRTRRENRYRPAVPKSSTRFSEGDYSPVRQTNPIYPGQWDDGSTTWKGPRPASVCACAENIM
jgi:hypothetical protein